MKTVAAAVFAVSFGLTLSSVALAAPFNNRGPDAVTTVQSESTAGRPSVADTHRGFNDRGADFIVDAPAGSPAQEPMISQTDKQAHRWNS
jgi:hypothetical protein